MTKIKNVKEFAELCGVSTATVSRALSGSGRVGADTRQRIISLAEKLGYEPNQTARNLRKQKTMTVGVMVPLGHDSLQHLSDPFFNTMTGFLADELSEHGYDLLLSRVIPNGEDWLSRYINSGKVDGVIIIGQSDQGAAIEDVARRYSPLVVWGGQVPGQSYCSVGSDNRKGGLIAGRHLIERGCRSLAFAGPSDGPEFGERIAGVRQAVEEAGITEPVTLLPSHFEPNAAFTDLLQVLRKCTTLPDGIVAGADVMAMSVLRALASLGVKVPQQIKVIGYDGLPIGELIQPALSTIDQELRLGAKYLVELLIDRIGGEATSSRLIEPKLVVRASS